MSYSGSLEKMVITAYANKDFSGQIGQPFTVYINPEKYSHLYEIKYNNKVAQGSPGGSPDFNRIGDQHVSFELVFDGTGVVPTSLPGVVPFTEDGITTQIEKFKELVFSYNGKIHSPNFLKLVWGTLVFKCRMMKLDFSYTLFKPDGTPLRARANTTFCEYTSEQDLAKEANNSSPDMSHLVTVLAGDTLPLMCYRIYGESQYYTEVARINGLVDFRHLNVGERLLFPPLRDANG